MAELRKRQNGTTVSTKETKNASILTHKNRSAVGSQNRVGFTGTISRALNINSMSSNRQDKPGTKLLFPTDRGLTSRHFPWSAKKLFFYLHSIFFECRQSIYLNQPWSNESRLRMVRSTWTSLKFLVKLVLRDVLRELGVDACLLFPLPLSKSHILVRHRFQVILLPFCLQVFPTRIDIV